MSELTLEEAWNIALQHHHAGRLQQAESIYRQILAHHPTHAGALHLLGLVSHQTGHDDVAADLVRRSIEIEPANAEAWNNLGAILRALRHPEEAAAACNRALALRPGFIEAQVNLGNAWRDQGQLDRAMASYRKALRRQPGNIDAGVNFAAALRDAGRIEEAITTIRRVSSMHPDSPGLHSAMIELLNYVDDLQPDRARLELRRWNDTYVKPLAAKARPHSNDRSPDRRLRIGYVSADFRRCPVGHALLTLLREHDPEQVEVICYSSVRGQDDLTQRFNGHADLWHNIVRVGDEQAAAQMRFDQIDILVDPGLHSEGNRLPIFAHQPAPIQVVLSRYPGSSGIESMHYRFSDRFLDPNQTPTPLYTEQPVRLENSLWCYDAPGEEPNVNPLPMTASGFVTFVCGSSLARVGQRCVNLWAQALKAVSNSRLLLTTPMGAHRLHLVRSLEQQGVAGWRVLFVPPASGLEGLRHYHRGDIALDTHPASDPDAVFEALWMGLPVVTLAGALPASRAGLSHVAAAGMAELAADTPERFTQIAVGLATDPARLLTLRAGLRSQLLESPLMDSRRYARGIEAAYRQLWQKWCASPR